MSRIQTTMNASTTSPPRTAMKVPPFGANFSTLVSPSSVPVARVMPWSSLTRQWAR